MLTWSSSSRDYFVDYFVSNCNEKDNLKIVSLVIVESELPHFSILSLQGLLLHSIL